VYIITTLLNNGLRCIQYHHILITVVRVSKTFASDFEHINANPGAENDSIKIIKGIG